MIKQFFFRFQRTIILVIFGLIFIIIIPLLLLVNSIISHHVAESRKTYFVSPAGNDDNDGSHAHPFATIQKAANMAVPGTTIHVIPGTYTTPLDTKASGTAVAPITYFSETKWSARIKTKGVSESWINEGNYVDIIGFDITGDGSYGIFNKGSYVRIIANHVHNIPASSCDRYGGAGIVNANYNGHDDDVIGNVVHDIGPLTDCNLVHGIYQANLRGHIWNNISYRNAAWGIHLWHAANAVTIANNLVFENRKGGILIGAGEEPGGVTDDHVVVTNNIVIYNHGLGISEYGDTGTHNRYLDNLVFANSVGIQLQNGNKDQGTLSVDPQFVDYRPDGSGDYHLKPTSPAIDAGTSIGAPPDDINGISRPQGKGFDIGPYEYFHWTLTSIFTPCLITLRQSM